MSSRFACTFAFCCCLTCTGAAVALAPDDCQHNLAVITQARGVYVQPASVQTGQMYWKLVDIAWCDPDQGGGKVNIFYRVKNQAGQLVAGQQCIAHYGSTDVTVLTKSPPDWGDFPMSGGNWCPSWPQGGNGPYSAWVAGAPSDRVIGMGLPCNYHESYWLTWQYTQATDPTTGTIQGTVTFAGQGLSNVTVTTSPGSQQATTNASGQYTMGGVAPGTYTVTAARSGYNSQSKSNIQVVAGQTATVDFTLTQGQSTISGYVRDAANNPLVLARVMLSPGNFRAVTGNDGSYQIQGMSAGTYSVTAYAPTKNEQTIAGQTVPENGSITVNFNLTDSGKVAFLWDDFNGNYLNVGDFLEESFQFGFSNHEYFKGSLPAEILPPHTGTNGSQKFQVTITNDQFASYFETHQPPAVQDKWFDLFAYAQQQGWPQIDSTKPITYLIYVKGVNMANDPNDPNKYWRQALSVHYPVTNANRDELDWTSANAGTWQMLRATTTGLKDFKKIWLTFESWYPAYYGQHLGGKTSWMVFENLWIEYTPLGDITPPGPVSNFTAVGGVGSIVLSWKNPSDSDFLGTRIRYRTDTYPTGPQDGTLLIDKSGSAGANDSTTHSGLGSGTTVYYAAFAYDSPRNYSTAQTAIGTVTSLAPGDIDGDGDVDQADFGAFQACFSGIGIAQDDPACARAKLDADADVDINDFGIFQRCMSGANVPANPNCANQ